ncbi:SusC/RagA family TonB-linked outer membrane protein [Rufibacter tibetensis]|uniref:SusC/RagA family TonB-linked outer membrane protein n=1 Tax=Rufibacter tibetensis TaxID=512763 RepID=A0A0P0CDK0_9BACT|nr:SusC/RagA family TonB-linked outer membrane protein [Rufibacter tibetensis]ALI99866.1 SusC/RagA family TonB-linked outer membrane protein [Rufibacter tibetensis]
MKRFLGNFSCFFLSAVLVFCSVLANAQDGQTIIRGTVTDKVTKEPLIGVSVYEIDNENRTLSGVSTDINGSYALRMKSPQNKIVVSYIGYKNMTINVNNRSVINVPLESTMNMLNTVEVISQQKTSTGMMDVDTRNQTSAISTIDATKLAELPAASIDEALQGRLAGVDIVASTGDPGAGMQIRIRGTSSINSSSEPLIVVDGMPYDIEIASDFNFATADEQGYAQLLNIAPSDIKEISVLKDAAATAIWGARASNGVLVITTKRGRIGKPAVNYAFRGSVTKQPDPLPMLSGDQYSQYIPEAFMNRTGAPLRPDVKEFQYDPNDPYWYHNYNKNTNWIDEITQLGHIQDHNVSLSGGGDKARYYTSLGFFKQRGTTIGTDLSRISARINLDFTVSDRIRFRTDLSYTHLDNNQNYAKNLRGIAYNKMPNMSVYEYNEFGERTPNYFSPANNVQGGFSGLNGRGEIIGTLNPVAMALAGINRQLGERIIPKFNLQYDILPSVLMATSDIQFDINNTKTKMFLPQTATGRPWTETTVNRASDSDSDRFSVVTKSNLLYTPRLGDNHSLQGIFSFMTFDARNESYGVLTSNTASAYLQDPSIPARIQGGEHQLGSGSSQTRSVGALLSAQYGFMDRYIVNVSVRRDGSSRFGENNRYGTFPAVSARWRVSGENFMQGVKFINDLSLRGSYGASGNEPRAAYGHYDLYQNYNYNYLGMAGLYQSTLKLNNLKWEQVLQSNVGINLIMLDQRVSIDADIYKRRTKDMFFQDLLISSITGFTDIDMNVGTMDNMGWEVGLNLTAYKTKDLTVDFGLNLSQNQNMIREISEFYPRERGNLNANGNYLITIQENNPFGSFYGYKFKGVYKDAESTIAKDKNGNAIIGPNGQVVPMRFGYPTVDYVFQPGDAMYEDINHDGNIDYKDVVYLGNANPRLTGGFGPTVRYKNWRLNMFFNFRYKYDIVNQTKMYTENMYDFSNQSTAILRRWRRSGDVTDMPRALNNMGYNWLASDRYVEDGSFLRFKTVTVRYYLPKHLIQRLRANDLSFYVTANNLFTFTNYTGQDPEVGLAGGDPFRIGFDTSRTPPVQTLTLGFDVRF